MTAPKIKFSDLVSELKVDSKAVRAKVAELGLNLGARARVVDPAVAEQIREAFAPKKIEPEVPQAPRITLIKKAKPAPVAEEAPAVVAAPTPEEVKPAIPTPSDLIKSLVAPKEAPKVAKPKPVILRQTTPAAPSTPSFTPRPSFFQRPKMHGAKKKKKKIKVKPQEEVQVDPIIASGEAIPVPENIIVKDFAAKIGVPVTDAISTLIQNGFMVNLNQEIDFETASLIASELGKEIVKSKEQAANTSRLTGQDLKRLTEEKDTEKLVTRSPIVTVMGHVDHGKTTLLDAIRKTSVVEHEAGGITQSIGAYQVVDKGRAITFLDTPGHEAFIEMRQRGANVTDVVVLVVAANDGVRPQTIEAMNHAKAAGVPIIVAVNKIDLPEANIERVKKEMSDIGLVPEDWGGKTVFVPVSAKQKIGIQELEDTILLVADLQELKANPNRDAVGFVVESEMTAKEGPVATILVNAGTLKLGQHIVVGDTFGSVRSMSNYVGEAVTEAGPSMPVRIVGLNRVPKSGDILRVTASRTDARSLADQVAKEEKLLRFKRKVEGGDKDKVEHVTILLRADSQGSLEAIDQTLSTLKLEGVSVNFVHKGVGEISESHIMLAAASKAWVVGFNVAPSPQAEKMASREKIEISRYDVIYDLIEETKKRISDLVPAEVIRHNLGELQVLAIFRRVPGEMIVGGKVTKGAFKIGVELEVFRGDSSLGSGKLRQLQRNKMDVQEVKEPDECGITFQGNVKIKEGDTIKAFTIEERKKTF